MSKSEYWPLYAVYHPQYGSAVKRKNQKVLDWTRRQKAWEAALDRPRQLKCPTIGPPPVLETDHEGYWQWSSLAETQTRLETR